MEKSAPELTVVFVDETRIVRADDPVGLVFGRGADLDIDSNPFLHRRVGRFVAEQGIWWIENLSSWTPLRVIADGAAAIVKGNARAPLLHTSTTVRFEAGSCAYDLVAELPDAPSFAPPPGPPADDRTATYRLESVTLTTDERRLAAALGEQRLLDPLKHRDLPSNASVAGRLGWSITKYNRKLDYLCRRLERAGVSDLRAEQGRANDRRLRLVEHLITTGDLTVDDLQLLDESPPSSSPDGSPG